MIHTPWQDLQRVFSTENSSQNFTLTQKLSVFSPLFRTKISVTLTVSLITFTFSHYSSPLDRETQLQSPSTFSTHLQFNIIRNLKLTLISFKPLITNLVSCGIKRTILKNFDIVFIILKIKSFYVKHPYDLSSSPSDFRK